MLVPNRTRQRGGNSPTTRSNTGSIGPVSLPVLTVGYACRYVAPVADTPELVGVEMMGKVAQSWAGAFIDDPMARWGLRTNAGKADLTELFRALLAEYIPVGAAWQLADGAGAAAWLPPSATALFADLEQRTRAAIRPLTPDSGEAYSQFWDWLDEHIPSEPVWVLDVVGVDPALQGLGLGRRLIEHGLAMASADGLAAFLETGNQRNVPYYEHFGFRVIRDADAPSGGPHIWFLRHDP